VGQSPEQPAEGAGQLKAAQIGHSKQGSDHRHAAEIKPTEAVLAFTRQLGQQIQGNPAPHLHGRSGHAQQGIAINGVQIGAEVPHHPDLWMTWNREVGLDYHPPASINRASTAIGQQLAEMGKGAPLPSSKWWRPPTPAGPVYPQADP
jgi:hypothetical protein